jgi:hypothetical protein
MATRALAQEAARPAPANAEITSVAEGTVLNELTKEPLQGVKVDLFTVDAISDDPNWDAAAYSAVTDIAGRFRVENVKAGKYEVRCGKDGFVPGRVVPGAVSGPERVTFALGETRGGLSYTLAPAAIVSGRVLDEDHNPIRNASVALPMPFGPDDGKHGMILRLAAVKTNETGEYRLNSLWPGDYYLEATPPPAVAGAAATKPASDGPRRALVTTYYPGASDPAQAMLIKLSAGQELGGQDIVLRREKVVNVSGHVLASDGAAAKSITLSLAPRYLVGSSYTIDTDNHGAFTIQDLQPGDYIFLVADKNSNDAPITYIQLPVGDNDRENVTLRMQTLEASGAFVLEGSDKSDKKDVDYSGCHIRAMPTASDLVGLVNATVKHDGTFRLARLMAGSVTLGALCRAGGESYIQSILVGGTDVFGTEVDSADLAANGIKVIVRNDAARAGGTLDIPPEKRAALKSPLVVLLPTDARLRRAGTIATSAIDGNNHFQHTGVRPGEYLAFAFEQANQSTFEDPHFYTLIQSKGERAILAPGESKTLSLKLLPWPPEFADRIHP